MGGSAGARPDSRRLWGRGARCRGLTGPAGAHAAPDDQATATATAAPTTTAAPTGGEDGTPAAQELSAPCRDAYEGQTVSFVVPYSAGGGFDTYARMFAPYLEKQLGATVVVENQPGAGGLLAINNLLTKEGDANTIASTIQDVQAAEQFRFASSGPGGSDYVTPSVLMEVFDLGNAEIVTGYDGSPETELAAIRGDVEGMTGDVDSRLPAIERGEQQAILAFTRERVEELPDVPAITELEGELDEELADPPAVYEEVLRAAY